MVKIVDPSGRVAMIDEPENSLEQFKRQVGTKLGLEHASVARLELSCKGKALIDNDDMVSLAQGDVVLCFVKPKKCTEAEQKQRQDDDDGGDPVEREVNNLFSWNEQRPRWLKQALLNTCRIPEWMIGPITHISGKQWTILSVWMVGSKLASRWDLGPIYLLFTLFYVMFRNLGKRTGEFSAYSIFNRGARRLNGQLDSAQLHQQLGYL